MKLLITGLTLKSIQGEAGISVKLASKHWIRILEKLDVQNEFAIFKLPMRIN
jgi:DNA-binding CsgD family transcriptional regulator